MVPLILKTIRNICMHLIVAGDPVLVDWNVFGIEKFAARTVFA